MIKNNWIIMISGLVLVSALLFYVSTLEESKKIIVPKPTTTTPYGKVTVKIGETTTFPDNSIKLLRVFDESRCPTDVTCIWAGTVKVEILSVSGLGTSTATITLGETFTTEAEQITFKEATPYPKSGSTIKQEEYRVTFEVLKKPAPINTGAGKCYVGGCSSQLCSDKPDMMSDCMYREVYACYKTAVCERQTNGECGWTKNAKLEACILKNGAQ